MRFIYGFIAAFCFYWMLLLIVSKDVTWAVTDGEALLATAIVFASGVISYK